MSTAPSIQHLIRHLLLAAVLLPLIALAQPLPECYTSRAELEAFLFDSLEAFDTRNIVHIDTIGWSYPDLFGEPYPLFSVKISDTADVFQDEPTVLIVGHIHAEEVMGLELTLEYMKRLVRRYNQYAPLINNTQLYFVPSMNPAGLEVISRGLDRSWRKNAYRPAGLAGCTIVPGEGQDSCGVDLNRNFALNWIFGDTLWYRVGREPFDYYRGPAPMSEPETQAIANLAREIKPVVSAVFHSSRTGNFSEQGIYAWEWGADPGPYRHTPDSILIGSFAGTYCSMWPKMSQGGGYYTPSPGHQRNGNLQDWFYRELGTIQMNTEVGVGASEEGIHPTCDNLAYFIQESIDGLDWLCRRPINLAMPGGAPGFTPLTIRTFDAVTGLPISCEWRNATTWDAILNPWHTNAQYGSATTLLPREGQYQFLLRKEGYVPQTFTQGGGNSVPVTREFHLQPIPRHNLVLRIRDEALQPIAGRVFLGGEYPRWIDLPAGDAGLSVPEGDYYAIAVANNGNRLILWRSFHVAADHAEWFSLPAANSTFAENFSNGLDSWTIGGTGDAWRLGADTTAHGFGNTLSTEPAVGFRPLYAPNLDTWVRYNSPIALGSGNASVLTFMRRGRMDMPFDSLLVEVSTDGANWVLARGFSDLELPWVTEFVNLSAWAGQSVWLRFRFNTDETLGDLGIQIDNLQIFTGIDTATPERPTGPVYEYQLTGAYPNPFNPATTITYDVAAPGAVELAIFNTLGEEVRRFAAHPLIAGHQRLTWDGTAAGGAAVSSGLYFVQLRAGGKISTHKLMLLR